MLELAFGLSRFSRSRLWYSRLQLVLGPGVNLAALKLDLGMVTEAET